MTNKDEIQLNAMMSTMGGGARSLQSRKSTCLFLALGGCAVVWAGVAVIGFMVEPSDHVYAPVPVREGQGLWLMGGHAVTCPAGWTLEASNRLKGPGGSTMTLTGSSVTAMRMSPRQQVAPGGKATYTALGYARSMKQRLALSGDSLYARYIVLGERKGAEAAVVGEKGRFVRGFVLVDEKRRTVELLFSLDQGPESTRWQEAEAIFCSIVSGIARPTPEKPEEEADKGKGTGEDSAAGKSGVAGQ